MVGGNSLYPPIERTADHVVTLSYVSLFSVRERGRFSSSKVIILSCLFFAMMSSNLPRVTVWSHSFVKRLHADLERGFHPQACSDFALDRTACVSLFGRGGRTIPKLWSHDLHVISRSPPDIVILEIGTNDLSTEEPLKFWFVFYTIAFP